MLHIKQYLTNIRLNIVDFSGPQGPYYTPSTTQGYSNPSKEGWELSSSSILVHRTQKDGRLGPFWSMNKPVKSLNTSYAPSAWAFIKGP